jgi:hypothetical protein
MAKGTLVVISPEGQVTEVPVKKLDISEIQAAVSGYVERIKVRYEGKVRDCYLNEEGLLRGMPYNPKIRELAEAYYGRPCQDFAGVGVIWVPTPRAG